MNNKCRKLTQAAEHYHTIIISILYHAILVCHCIRDKHNSLQHCSLPCEACTTLGIPSYIHSINNIPQP
jgi:hypothetical protein